MASLIITIEFEDSSDLDWLKTRLEAAVEEKVADAEDEGRLDGKVEISAEVDFG